MNPLIGPREHGTGPVCGVADCYEDIHPDPKELVARDIDSDRRSSITRTAYGEFTDVTLFRPKTITERKKPP